MVFIIAFLLSNKVFKKTLASTVKEPTTRLQSGAGVSRVIHRYPHQLDMGLEEDRLVVNWMSREPAPVAVLELLSCRCKRRCQLPNCTCLSNGLKCTDLCKLKDCDNLVMRTQLRLSLTQMTRVKIDKKNKPWPCNNERHHR